MLAAKLGQILGGREVLLTEAVDRTRLGGFIMESGSFLLDGSLDGQLERLRRRLASA
jgi:F0F1-type ATP synthase delta subunit